MGEKDEEKSSAALTVNVQVSAISKPEHRARHLEQGILDGCRDALLEMTCPVLGF